MLKPRKKISKKELKEDKFILYTLKARDYIQDNAKMLLQIGIGVLILIILVTFYVRSKQSANMEANALLGEAQFAQNQGKMDRAESLLKQLAKDYEGVTAAGQGSFMLAKLYWNQGDYTNAKKYFKMYIDDYAEDDLLTSAAYAGYADCLMQEEKVSEAAEYYQNAARVNSELPETPAYLYSAARAYMEAEQYDKAKRIAEDLINNHENSEYKQQAEILLNMVKFKA